MYKVKLTFPYPQWNLIRQSPNSSGIWGDYQFHINEDLPECDFWFVFNELLLEEETTNCAKENIVLLTAEPIAIQQYNHKFTNQFGHIITCQKEIEHPKTTYFLQGHPWFVGAHYNDGGYSSFSKSFDELIATDIVPKTKSLSIITSNKLYTDGHKKRFDFANTLKDYFGSAIDLYGRGVNDFSDKWDVLAEYKYSIAIENSVYPHYISEKIVDCYLAHTFPIYYGGPNLSTYFSPKSYIAIDIDNIEESKRSIETLLNSPTHYEDSLPEIIKAKRHYLNNYNMFPLMAHFIEQHLRPMKGSKQKLRSTFPPTITQRIVNKLKSLKS